MVYYWYSTNLGIELISMVVNTWSYCFNVIFCVAKIREFWVGKWFISKIIGLGK
jgi:hypothetical protein